MVSWIVLVNASILALGFALWLDLPRLVFGSCFRPSLYAWWISWWTSWWQGWSSKRESVEMNPSKSLESLESLESSPRIDVDEEERDAEEDMEEEKETERKRVESPSASSPSSLSLLPVFSYCRHNRYVEMRSLLESEDRFDASSSISSMLKARDRHGNTPLIVAAQNGHVDMCKLLTRFGCSPFDKNKNGKSPLDYARLYGYEDCVRFLENVERIAENVVSALFHIYTRQEQAIADECVNGMEKFWGSVHARIVPLRV